jgi:hypothetical protein
MHILHRGIENNSKKKYLNKEKNDYDIEESNQT